MLIIFLHDTGSAQRLNVAAEVVCAGSVRKGACFQTVENAVEVKVRSFDFMRLPLQRRILFNQCVPGVFGCFLFCELIS